MRTWTPDITEESVEIKTKSVMANYPKVGTRGIARLGESVLHGTFQAQYTPSTKWVAFLIDGTHVSDMLWIDRGWTFEIKDGQTDDEQADGEQLGA